MLYQRTGGLTQKSKSLHQNVFMSTNSQICTYFDTCQMLIFNVATSLMTASFNIHPTHYHREKTKKLTSLIYLKNQNV